MRRKFSKRLHVRRAKHVSNFNRRPCYCRLRLFREKRNKHGLVIVTGYRVYDETTGASTELTYVIFRFFAVASRHQRDPDGISGPDGISTVKIM